MVCNNEERAVSTIISQNWSVLCYMYWMWNERY